MATWENVVKPGLEGAANVLNHVDHELGTVRVADGVTGMNQGPLEHMADALHQGIDRLDREALRPPAINSHGKAAQIQETITQLKSEPLHDPARPRVQHIVRVPESMVPGPRTSWTKITDGFAPNAEYVVPGRGSFVTDAHGSIKEVLVDKVRGKISPELNNPLPDMTYKVNGATGDVTYKTDASGYTESVKVEGLELGDGRRSKHIQASVGQESNGEIYTQTPPSDGRRYEGGHLLARGFGGIEERINKVGMLRQLNTNLGNAKSFYKFEMAVRDKALEVPPPRIDLEINLVRRPRTKTPDRILVEASADGRVFIDQEFTNIVGMGRG